MERRIVAAEEQNVEVFRDQISRSWRALKLQRNKSLPLVHPKSNKTLWRKVEKAKSSQIQK